MAGLERHAERIAEMHPNYGGNPPQWLIEHWDTIDRWRAQALADREMAKRLVVCIRDANGELSPVAGWKAYKA